MKVYMVPGKRCKVLGTRRGRQKRRWWDSIRNDLSERELSGEDAQERAKWIRLIRHKKVGKDEEEEEEFTKV